METENKESEVKLTHRQKRLAKFKKRFFKEGDIKYHGPLSYRALKILVVLTYVGCIYQFILHVAAE